MKNSKVLFQELIANIRLPESPEEITTMAYLMLEKTVGVSNTDIMAGKQILVPMEAIHTLQRFIDRINEGEPLQYVLGEAYFFGRNFQVNPSVLIPRPETEELIRTVLAWTEDITNKKAGFPLRVLDIGTGSGCIATTLSLELRDAEVYASDVSNAALSVALDNVEAHGAKITLLHHDILKEKIPVYGLDIIVSNPPYVAESESREMKPNVLQFEPHLALFAPDEDPLVFYREITRKAKVTLRPSGLLAVEINERFGNEVSQLFIDNGFRAVEVIPDVSGKSRVVRGERAT